MKLVYIIRHINQLEAKEFLSILTVLVTFVALYYIGIAKDILLFWIIPYATLYQTLNRIRLSTEHFNITDVNLFKTRSVIPSVIEKFFFTPYNLGYHVEHHLYPSVPFYNLPKLHEILMKKADYKENVIVHTSYIRVLKDFIR